MRDPAQPWYHGSQQELINLRAGSSITQNIDVARAFSHRPSLLSQSDDGTVKHDGVLPGYLYVVTESIQSGDIYPHPHPVNESRWEWLTTRELRVRLVERTEVQAGERLSEEEIAELRRKQITAGKQSFVG